MGPWHGLQRTGVKLSRRADVQEPPADAEEAAMEVEGSSREPLG